MYYGNYNEINSRAACAALIRALKRQIIGLQNRDNELKKRRRRIPKNPSEISDVMKAAKAILLEPSYPKEKSWLLRQYTKRYNLYPDALEAVIGYELVRIAHERVIQNKKTTLIMHSKGKKQKDIARATGLTAGRISQILKEHRQSLEKRKAINLRPDFFI